MLTGTYMTSQNTLRRGRRRPSPPRSDAVEALRAIIRANVPANLGSYLRNLARASVIVGSVTAAGCSSSFFPPDAELTGPQCAAGSYQVVHGLSPSRETAYLGAFSNQGRVPEATAVDELGTPCSDASDAAACQATISELAMVTYGRYLRTTDGDEVEFHQTPEQVIELLGAIDTPQEALLRVWHAGYDVACDDLERSGVREVEGGWEVIGTQTAGGCGSPIVVSRFLFFVATDGAMTELSVEEIERLEDWGCEGRRPEGLQPVRGEVPSDPVGRWFASMARLEESAVDAFEGVARELEAHGAPGALVDASRVAAQDEVRHHAAMSRLALRFGATPIPAEIVDHPVRDLYEIALENAVEGCIRETYGALAAFRQAYAATDPEVATAMAEIAEDETRHAQLSWQIAEWIEPRLSASERAELVIAKARAFAELRAEARTEPNTALVDLAGVPDAATASALLDHLADTIFA